MTPGRRKVLWGSIVVTVGVLTLILTPNRPHRADPWAPEGEPFDAWNILLVSLDTTRPDYLEACGGDQVPTPGLDRIAGGGFVFEEMIAPTPVTLPSHASLFTGLNPPGHGVRENTEYALPQGSTTLAGTFRDAGYRTAAFVAAFVMDSRFGLGQGFEEYHDRMDGPEPGLGPASVEVPGSIMASRANRWINEHTARRRGGQETRPFFLFLHFFDAHAPYRPPSPYDREYADRPYAGELAYQDRCLGLVLDALESTGEASRTLVWVVSDHGESLGQHGEATHSLFIYEATQRAVSVLRFPPQDGSYRAGHPRMRIRPQTALVDVPVTLLALAGEAAALGPVEGVSLVPLLMGQSWDERPVYLETLSPWVSYHWSPLYGIRTGGWKYIRAPFPELYNLASDPDELRNVAGTRPDVAARLSTELDRLMQASVSGGPEPASARRTLSEDEAERLRSLGYLAGSGGPAGTGPDGIEVSSLPDPKRMVKFFHDQYQSAKSLLHAGRFEEAVTALRRALEVDPLNNSLHLYLAGGLRQTGEFRESIASYREALRIAPRSPRGEYGLGEAFLGAGMPDSAAAAFRRAADLLPGSPDAWRRLGAALWAVGDRPGAAVALEKALDAGAEPIRTSGHLARLYLEMPGSEHQARVHLERYARLRRIPAESAQLHLPPPPIPDPEPSSGETPD